ncbi:MAG: fumarylacetoacetate hydrolase family protein, partial [Lutibacter sp.]
MWIFNFTICNDYSEREWQKQRSGQFVKGKSADTFCPLGPYLVTPDE